MSTEVWAIVVSGVVSIVSVIATQISGYRNKQQQLWYERERRKDEDESAAKDAWRQHLVKQLDILLDAYQKSGVSHYKKELVSDEKMSYSSTVSAAIGACLACDDRELIDIAVGQKGFVLDVDKDVDHQNPKNFEMAIRRLSELIRDATR